MGLLSSEDKEKIKRAIPKGSNKIIYATVAKLYIAYPDPEDYTDTGLSGAVVLVDDTVGKTFFIKLVDIEGQRGVLWDQELSVNFQYNKDRTFFHSFELEEFYGGLLFEDVGEANHFFKRVTSKEKYGSKATVQNKNAFAAKKKAELDAQSKPDAAGPRGFGSIDFHDPNNAQKIRRAKNVIYYNDAPPPEWRDLYRKLDEEEGISESMIVENREFIKNYVTEHNYSTLIGLEPPIPRKYQYGSSNSTSRISSVQKKKKAPPPPPPSAPISSTASTPTPPPVPASHSSLPSPAPSAAPSPAPALPAKEPTTERKYRLPPAPSFLGEGIKQQFHTIPTNGGQSPYQQSRRQESYQQYQHQQTMAAINAVPPPPLPPKSPDVAPPIVNQPHLYASKPPPPPSRPSLPPRVPLNTGQTYTPQFGNPPRAPPTLPGRGVAPPPPPSRKSGGPAPPPPPSRKPLTNSSAFSTPPPPLPPQQTSNKYVQPFPLPPKVPSTPAPPVPIGGPPAPPQLPSGGPPAPPSQPASQPATGDPGRDALLASIRNAGIGQLKKVNKAEIKHF